MPDDGNADEVDERLTGKKRPTTYFETMMHLVRSYVGTGIFAMGDAYKNTGYILGTVLLSLFGFLAVHCQHQLVRCVDEIEEIEATRSKPDYGETVKKSFDHSTERFQRMAIKMKIFTNVFLYICEMGVCCAYIVFVGDHFRQVMESEGWVQNIHVHMSILIVPMWLCTFISNLKYLAPFSYMANICNFVGTFIIYYITIDDLPEAPFKQVNAFSPPLRYPLGMGTMLFGFAAIVCILQLRNEMRKPSQLRGVLGVLNTASFIVYLMYMSIGFVSYLRYGDVVQGSVILNFPTDGTKGIVCDVLKVFMVISVMVSFIIHSYILTEVGYPIWHEWFGPFKHPYFQRCLFKTMLVAINFTLAQIIPFLDLFISLTGVLTGTILVLVLPPVLELVTFHKSLSRLVVIKNIFIIVVAAILMLIGTGIACYEIYNALYKKYTS